MNNQFHQSQNNRQVVNQVSNAPPHHNQNLQFYHPQQQSTDLGHQLNYSYAAQPQSNAQNVRATYPSQPTNLNPNSNNVDMVARDHSGKAHSKNRSGVRPSSATVAGQAGRFLSNQQSKRKYGAGLTAGGQSGQSQMTSSQVDQISYSYQHPGSNQPMNQPMMNNLMQQSSSQALNAGQQYGAMNNLQVPQMGLQGSPNQFGSHRNSNQLLGQQQHLQRPPIGGARKKTRPQSAARNQMQPAKALQSVTNFTYQKAKQNLNQKAYMPESLKNTDKEKLYEEKISLKKQLNEMQVENQQLRTQLQSQQGHIKKKDEMVQHVMKQIFHPTSAQNAQSDTFLQQFQNREINHQPTGVGFVKTSAKPKASAAKIVKNQNILANKESLITSLKLKMKELAEGSIQKDKELQDLKQTLKFTKIKEYETELALNVQESQRLRHLLEREMQKPRVDPRLFQALKNQNSQFQQIISNPHQNEQIMASNIDKLNQKLINQVNKFAKLKAARKRVMEKNRRLEKKVMILNNKVNQLQAAAQQGKGQQRNSRGYQARRSPPRQQAEDDSIAKHNLAISKQIIDRLLAKMADCGVEVTEQELLEMQQQFQQEGSVIGDQNPQNQGFDAVQGDMEDEQKEFEAGMDLIVTFGAPSNGQGLNDSAEAITKQMQGAQFGCFDDLKDTLRREFDISDIHEFMIKYVNEHGSLMELSGQNWDQMKELSQTTQIQLAIELMNGQKEEEEEQEEASNYEDDFEEPAPPEKVYSDPVTLKQVKQHFQEFKIILQIKKIKRDDALKYILHGIKDNDSQKKIKKVTIDCLTKQISSRIGFTTQVASKLAKYLIEVPNEEGKVEQMDNQESNLTHAQVVFARRKDLQAKLLDNIDQYMLYNGLAITSMLNRIQGMFEDYATELLQELEDQDYDDEGTQPMNEIIKSMKLVGLYPDSFDEDIRDFIYFLALRHSKSLEEIEYKDFMKVFDEDYSFIDDKKSIWETVLPDGSPEPQYEPSSDDGELESSLEQIQDSPEIGEGSRDVNDPKTNSENIDDLDQNELLQKVDEILMQIVQKLPSSQKIRCLTELMTPYLITVFDEQQQRQYPIISQDAFIQFLLGQGQNQLGLTLNENHVICLLHLLVQEDDEGNNDDPEDSQSQNKFILFEEFIELVKTYMTKELILQQSKSLGINYDILGKQSVEFLFQIRSSLMHDNNQNINENSADEEENFNQNDQNQKSVPQHVREIFQRIIQKKSISMSKGSNKPQAVEVIDFDQMLDTLFMRLGIHCPVAIAQEQLKYLMCLDFKYLEMVKLVKFDKIMHDLDYISIDLLRQAQDSSQDKHRKMALDKLKKKRDNQLSKLKRLEAQKSALQNQQIITSNDTNLVPQIYGTTSQQVEFQGVMAGPSNTTKQDKKRKRPDDKKQNLSKKLGHRAQYPNDINIEASGSANKMPVALGIEKAILPKNHQSKSNQDNMATSSGGKERYANQGQKIDLHTNQINAQINLGSSQQDKRYAQAGDNFDDIDVDLDTDINKLEKNDHQKQIAIAAEIAAGENISEFDDEYLQDDIPIDDGEDEDGIISDNYDNLDDDRSAKVKSNQFDKTDKIDEQIGSFQDSDRKARSKQLALEDNVISMDHSDDIDESAPKEEMEMLDEVIQDSQNDEDEAIIDDVAQIDHINGQIGQIVDDMDDIDEDYERHITDNIQMDQNSEPMTDSQVGASPSGHSIDKSKSKTIKSSKELIESSIQQSKSYKSSKLSEQIQEQSFKSSHVSQQKSRKSIKNDEVDNYSEDEIESNRDLDESDKLDQLNFNKVEKDSSIQQVKTHEDDDQLMSSGSKASQLKQTNNFQSIPNKSNKSSQKIISQNNQSDIMESSKGKSQAFGQKSPMGMSHSSVAKSEVKDEIEDDYESYKESIKEEPSPKKSESIANSIRSKLKSESIANSIRSNTQKSLSKSMKQQSEAPAESINDEYASSKRSKATSKIASALDRLAESSVQQLEEGSMAKIEDEYEDDMIGEQSSIKSEKKSASRTSQKRLNNKSTHNQLPNTKSKGQIDDGIDDYVDDFGGGASSRIQDDVIQSDEGIAAKGAQPIQDDVYEEDLTVSLPNKQQQKPVEQDFRKSEQYIDDMAQNESDDYEF